ncbi:DUF2510 domain-containing protein [Salinibacterium sp. G-O1]|uniref:DUF2510 domain-containing protein n=1 Tax=Salinibacterium sp. G-O1 TaxID=3046208 RepID=UPI0024BA645A|nr:DUF2510 domain-containing protein [Salinibacterium sp. G-O1]MDJ0333922.1 DUF2510 domain-containing protein [Salinibacterium sp. G-O1]
MDDNFGVAAGWYPDPLGLPQLRWWDSVSWTEHTSEARAPIVLHPTTILGFADDDSDDERTPDFEGDDFPSRREQRARERRENGDLLQASAEQQTPASSESAEDVEIDLGLHVDDDRNELSARPLLAMTLRELEPPLTETVDDGTPGPRRASTHANALPATPLLSAMAETPEADEEAPVRAIKKVRTYTVAVWAIALMPFFQVVACIVLVTVLGLGSNWPLVIATIALPYFVVLGLASYDRLVLQVRGHVKPANGFWALLTPLGYLIVRSVRTYRQTGKGFAPLVVFATASLSVVAGILVVPGILLAALPGPFADEAAASARATAMSLGGDITLACPSPPLLVGDTFTCVASKPSGETDSVSIALERENGWIVWRVQDWGSWVLTAD